MSRCEVIRGQWMEALSGELAPLARSRLDAHLNGCAQCAHDFDALKAQVMTARSWTPNLPPEFSTQQWARLEPFVGERKTPPWKWVTASLATGAAAALLVITVFANPKVTPATESHTKAIEKTAIGVHQHLEGDLSEGGIVAVAGKPQSLGESTAPATPKIVHHAINRFVAVANYEGFMSQVVRGGRKTVVVATKGMAAFSFVGGEGRRLRVRTPHGRVDVVGTRFAIHAESNQTTVAVTEGEVRVYSGGAKQQLGAGEAVVLRAERKPESIAFPKTLAELGDDTSLRKHHDNTSPSTKRSARASFSAKQLDQILESAEMLATDGEFALAIDMLQEVEQSGVTPYADVARFERGRILGFELGAIEAAQKVLRIVADKNRGEPSRQARLALCELEGQMDACAGHNCLTELISRGGDEAKDAKAAAQRLPRCRATEKLR